MGYIKHDLLHAWVFDSENGYASFSERVKQMREEMPPEFARLLIGPVKPVVNGGEQWVFLPDGSKEGWDTSDDGDKWRGRFIDALKCFEWQPEITRVFTGDDGSQIATGEAALTSATLEVAVG